MIYVTGDTHGEHGRFEYKGSAIERTLTEKDKLIVCGDFGYIFMNTEEERQFLKYLAEKPYQILFVDGNHENFNVINEFPVEEWCGGKVHIIERDAEGTPKIIHLMRGQVFTIEGKKVFTFGGAYSKDQYMRTPYYSWWPQEMPTDDEMKEAIQNLEAHHYEVDYIITHAAPEEMMNLFYRYHQEEKPLNNFLEWVRESVKYEHWWFGHLHMDEDLWKNQTCLLWQLRNAETNEAVEELDEIV